MTFRYQHLQKINQTYFQHLQNAFSYAAQCQKASLYFMVHAWFMHYTQTCLLMMVPLW